MDAESVVIDLLIRNDQFDRDTQRSADNFDRSMQKIGQSAERAENQVGRSSDRMSNSTRNLGRQIADIGTQLAGHQNPFLIIAEQAPQVADALADTTGVAGKMAAFFAGPWGAALLAAASAAGVLLSDLIKLGNAVDEEIAKLQKNAQHTDAVREAKDRFAKSAEGVRQAILQQNDALDQEATALRTSAENANISAKNKLAEELAIRRKTQATLEEAIAEERLLRTQAAGPGQRGELSTLGLDAASGRVAGLQAQLQENNRLIAQAEQNLERTRVALGAEQAEQVKTPLDVINSKYDDLIKKARIEGDEAAKAGDKVAVSVNRRIALLNSEREAQLKLERDREEAARKAANAGPTTQFLRPVTGGTISSPFGRQRSYETHPGVDIAVPVGTPVRAPAAGAVSYAGDRGAYGNLITINFGSGTTGRFGHLSRFNVKPGDTVDAGDIIGYTGGAAGAEGSGNSTGPHLHYEIRRNGRAVNPFGAFPTDATGADISTKGPKLKEADDIVTDIRKGLAESEVRLDRMLNTDPNDAARRNFRKVFGDEDPVGDAVKGYDQSQRVDVDAWNEERNRRKALQESDIRDLAVLYEDLFTGGAKSVWDDFKREGLRVIAQLLAKWTVAALTKDSDGGSLNGLLKSGTDALSSIIGGFRASGGPVEAGRLYTINEGAAGGRVEGFVPSTGGKVIPLGRMAAASTGGGVTVMQTVAVDARGAVMNDQFAQLILARAGQQAAQISAASSRSTLAAVPARLKRYDDFGT